MFEGVCVWQNGYLRGNVFKRECMRKCMFDMVFSRENAWESEYLRECVFERLCLRECVFMRMWKIVLCIKKYN